VLESGSSKRDVDASGRNKAVRPKMTHFVDDACDVIEPHVEDYDICNKVDSARHKSRQMRTIGWNL
jgi:hypothetical protein